MKLKRHKDIASLFINKKKVEEDCEGMTAGSVLAPSAQATGGNITNTDSYAPGDNRIPKSLFKTRVIKRNIKKKMLKNILKFRLISLLIRNGKKLKKRLKAVDAVLMK